MIARIHVRTPTQESAPVRKCACAHTLAHAYSNTHSLTHAICHTHIDINTTNKSCWVALNREPLGSRTVSSSIGKPNSWMEKSYLFLRRAPSVHNLRTCCKCKVWRQKLGKLLVVLEVLTISIRADLRWKQNRYCAILFMIVPIRFDTIFSCAT